MEVLVNVSECFAVSLQKSSSIQFFTTVWLMCEFDLDSKAGPRCNEVDNSVLVEEIPISSRSSLWLNAQKGFMAPYKETIPSFADLMFCPAKGSGKHSNSCKTSGENN